MAVSTLSLDSGSYTLLDDLDALAVTKGNNTLISSDNQITDLGINGLFQTNSNVTIKADIQNFTADLGAGNDNLNIIGNVDSASILFGNQLYTGSNRLDIRGNLTASSSVLGDLESPQTEYIDTNSNSETYGEIIGRNQISGAAGNDSFKISGIVEDTNFYMAAGSDSLVIGGAAEDVYVNTGAGNDLVEFRGSTNNIIVQTDSGNDTVIFRNELIGLPNYDDVTAAVELGAGNDSLTLANGASYAEINTGSGKDILRLTGDFANTEFYLSGTAPGDTFSNTGDSISISANSKFYDSSFSSINTLGDTLIVGSNSLWDVSNIYFADGNDSLVFGSNATFIGSRISLGGGNDTLVFGSSTMFSNTTIDLGEDNLVDVLRFASDFNLSEVEFIGYDDTDIYYIGADKHYFSTLGQF